MNYRPNALLLHKNTMGDWGKYCDRQMLNLIIEDLKKSNFEIEQVAGNKALWDVTAYLESETSCSYETKIRAIHAFSCCYSIVVLDGESIFGDFNLMAKLIKTNRVSSSLADELIDLSYKQSKAKDNYDEN